MRPLLLLGLLAAACGGPRREPTRPAPAPTTEQVVPAGPQSKDDHVVAFVNGRPVTWRQVAERAMNLGGRQLIDQYVHWMLRQDFLRTNGISSTPADLRARAKGIVDQARRTQGDAKVDAALKQEGLTEAQYIDRFVADPLFAERFLTELALVYAMFVEATIEVDTVAFTEEADAEGVASRLKNGADLARAVEGLGSTTRGRIVQWPRRRVARGYLPSSMAHLEQRLFAMKEGESTGLERTPGNLLIIARIASVHPAAAAPFAQVRDRVMEEILRSPPGDEQIRLWTERLFRGSKIQYEERYSQRKE